MSFASPTYMYTTLCLDRRQNFLYSSDGQKNYLMVSHQGLGLDTAVAEEGFGLDTA